MLFLNENPKSILENIKKLLITGVKDRKHTFHLPVFTNISNDGFASSRVVVLRHFDEKNFILKFHTDFRSPKIDEIKKNNNSSFVFYDSKLKIQLRIKTKSFINNQNEMTKNTWENVALLSRKCYLTTKNPSSITSHPEDGIPFDLIGKEPTQEESEIGYKNFSIVENIITTIDWLYLASSGHRRLQIEIKNKIPNFRWTIP
tara:strand:- start:34906 stop:35511 length:606 start_codon:yes stop_codon:yes gene_type:complete